MPKACSADLRERVIAAVEEGASRREAAECFCVSVSSAVKWRQFWEREGRRAAKPRRGSRSPLEKHREELFALVAEHPDRTLDELVAAMRKRDVSGAAAALFGGFWSATASVSRKRACARWREWLLRYRIEIDQLAPSEFIR